ncbi:P-type DNA transfer ATPase VirB11 [Parasphingopyxis lamellibrachiae]|uniref:Type IV secretion system protein n=1 Tax=Parasphingopyxis lamellibrachiae TaxID=680125 RepID=A0A3D9F8N8_9SPHN|nr:P-type DNA transfer ATPase VirB11 [Parasphingopyxis lamellibrachiae]RED12668.1 type IV secretion system protein VirB11 [Parasphingopyxis lamellibrachiae]
MSQGVISYLESFLAPLARDLNRHDVTDIFINKPGELWVETLGGRISSRKEHKLNAAALERLARQIAASSSQGISREHPLLSATLPSGERVQIVAPPATRGDMAFAIRKHVSSGLKLADYAKNDAFSDTQFGAIGVDPLPPSDTAAPPSRSEAVKLLRSAVRSRKNILISGGTSSGKTTFLNALVREIPADERLIFIEDTRELEIVHDNAVGLLAARSSLSEAQVDAEDLLNASLRMRPDRIMLGEVRGPEAFTFLRAVNTGHPGSMTTIHADSPRHAVDQLALLVLQSGARLGWDDIVRYVRSTIDIFVQLDRRGGKRGIAQILSVDELYDDNAEAIGLSSR